MESGYKTGILRNWNATRGFGFVECPRNVFPIQKYFLHVSEIKDGPCPPEVGSILRFLQGAPRKEGQYPTATDVTVIILPEKTATAVRS